MRVLVVAALAPVALVAQLLPGKKTRDRSATEVASYLRNFIEGSGGEWDWDDFESVPIADPELNEIRREACKAAPPNPDMAKLADLLRRAEALAEASGLPA
jgi:hypothetical protein